MRKPARAATYLIAPTVDGLWLHGDAPLHDWFRAGDDAFAPTRRSLAGRPAVPHSTSWCERRDVYDFNLMAALDRPLAGAPGRLVPWTAFRTLDALDGRGAPAEVVHGVQHLAFLLITDPDFRAGVGVTWARALAGVPPTTASELCVAAPSASCSPAAGALPVERVVYRLGLAGVRPILLGGSPAGGVGAATSWHPRPPESGYSRAIEITELETHTDSRDGEPWWPLPASLFEDAYEPPTGHDPGEAPPIPDWAPVKHGLRTLALTHWERLSVEWRSLLTPYRRDLAFALEQRRRLLTTAA